MANETKRLLSSYEVFVGEELPEVCSKTLSLLKKDVSINMDKKEDVLLVQTLAMLQNEQRLFVEKCKQSLSFKSFVNFARIPSLFSVSKLNESSSLFLSDNSSNKDGYLSVESLASVISEGRRVTHRNSLKWIQQLFATIYTLHKNYVSIGRFSVHEITLQADNYYITNLRLWSKFTSAMKRKQNLEKLDIRMDVTDLDDTARNAWINIIKYPNPPAVSENRKQRDFKISNKHRVEKIAKLCLPLNAFFELKKSDMQREGVCVFRSEFDEKKKQSIIEQFMEFALCMQTDLRCLGIVILQIFIKRVFQQKELNFWKSWKSLRVQDDHKIDDSKVEQGSNDRLTSSEEEEQKTEKENAMLKLVEVELLLAANDELKDCPLPVLQLLSVCFAPIQEVDEQIQESRTGFVLTLKIPFHRTLKVVLSDLADIVLDHYASSQFTKESIWTKEDEDKRISDIENRKAILREKADQGVKAAAERIRAAKYQVWWDLQSPEYRVSAQRRKKYRLIADRNTKERGDLLNRAFFHNWKKEDFRDWICTAIMDYYKLVLEFQNQAELQKPKKPQIYIQHLLVETFQPFEPYVIEKILNKYYFLLEDSIKEKLAIASGANEIPQEKTKRKKMANLSIEKEVSNLIPKTKPLTFQEEFTQLLPQLSTSEKISYCFEIISKQFSKLFLHYSNTIEINKAIMVTIQEETQQTLAQFDKILIISEEQFFYKKLFAQCKYFYQEYTVFFLRKIIQQFVHDIQLLDRQKGKEIMVVIITSILHKFHLDQPKKTLGENLAADRIISFFRMIIVHRKIVPALLLKKQAEKEASKSRSASFARHDRKSRSRTVSEESFTSILREKKPRSRTLSDDNLSVGSATNKNEIDMSTETVKTIQEEVVEKFTTSVTTKEVFKFNVPFNFRLVEPNSNVLKLLFEITLFPLTENLLNANQTSNLFDERRYIYDDWSNVSCFAYIQIPFVLNTPATSATQLNPGARSIFPGNYPLIIYLKSKKQQSFEIYSNQLDYYQLHKRSYISVPVSINVTSTHDVNSLRNFITFEITVSDLVPISQYQIKLQLGDDLTRELCDSHKVSFQQLLRLVDKKEQVFNRTVFSEFPRVIGASKSREESDIVTVHCMNNEYEWILNYPSEVFEAASATDPIQCIILKLVDVFGTSSIISPPPDLLSSTILYYSSVSESNSATNASSLPPKPSDECFETRGIVQSLLDLEISLAKSKEPKRYMRSSIAKKSKSQFHWPYRILYQVNESYELVSAFGCKIQLTWPTVISDNRAKVLYESQYRFVVFDNHGNEIHTDIWKSFRSNDSMRKQLHDDSSLVEVQYDDKDLTTCSCLNVNFDPEQLHDFMSSVSSHIKEHLGDILVHHSKSTGKLREIGNKTYFPIDFFLDIDIRVRIGNSVGKSNWFVSRKALNVAMIFVCYDDLVKRGRLETHKLPHNSIQSLLSKSASLGASISISIEDREVDDSDVLSANVTEIEHNGISENIHSQVVSDVDTKQTDWFKLLQDKSPLF